MRSNKFLPKILLISGFLALFLIIKYQTLIKSSIGDVWSFNFEKIKIYFDNFFYQPSSKPKRQRPLSLLERETELKLYIGEPFRDFTERDWYKFWQLIYGAFPKDNPERRGLPKKMRQLTQEEIAVELTSRYPEPFAYFKDQHWQTFFSIILKK